MSEHVFVIYNRHRKSLWTTGESSKAEHLLQFLIDTGANYRYYPPNGDVHEPIEMLPARKTWAHR